MKIDGFEGEKSAEVRWNIRYTKDQERKANPSSSSASKLRWVETIATLDGEFVVIGAWKEIDIGNSCYDEMGDIRRDATIGTDVFFNSNPGSRQQQSCSSQVQLGIFWLKKFQKNFIVY